ncbi:MAG: MFS transporter [Acidobacteria bacterium]|nr:MFS transporter [Acidobacteriota bacterium]
MWKKFVPKYLEALGAPILAVGLYGTLRDFADGIFQYPGGWITDRYGRRAALLLFIGLAAIGYLIYLVAPSWPYIILGLFPVMAWASMASPTIFAVIGDTLPSNKRVAGFTLQSILKKLPVGAAAWLGGLAIGAYGIVQGVQIGLILTLGIAAMTAAVVASQIRVSSHSSEFGQSKFTVRQLSQGLRRLLASDILIRTCEGMVDVLVVIYATTIIGITAPQFGLLVAIQMITSIVVYVPAARAAERFGGKPFVIATFLFFALFPISVVASNSFTGLIGAFIIGGLREIGEPARKAMIVDLADPEFRGRTVGMYYLVRSLTIAPAAFFGGLLWRVTPATPFFAAGAIGLAGVIHFISTSKKSS